GLMAAVFAPLEEIERILKTIDGYVVIANINSEHQSVIGGASKAVEKAMEALQKAGYDVSPLSVSHAFHTTIVAQASETLRKVLQRLHVHTSNTRFLPEPTNPLRKVLHRLHVQAPNKPIVANTTGEFYPTGPCVVTQML